MSFNQDELIMEYNSCSDINTILNNLFIIIINSREQLEGCCFYNHNTYKRNYALLPKQLNLFWCGKQAKTKICEIGFNAGHSAMLMLLGCKKIPIEFTIFDIGEHRYTQPCLNYITSQFTHVNFQYNKGDSTITIPKWVNNNSQHIGTYDVIHVDGGHSEYCISNDMLNANTLIKVGGIIIIDDTNNQTINKYVDLYLSSSKYIEIHLIKTPLYPHRVIQKIEELIIS